MAQEPGGGPSDTTFFVSLPPELAATVLHKERQAAN
jgi:hypothetical protein